MVFSLFAGWAAVTALVIGASFGFLVGDADLDAMTPLEIIGAAALWPVMAVFLFVTWVKAKVKL